MVIVSQYFRIQPDCSANPPPRGNISWELSIAKVYCDVLKSSFFMCVWGVRGCILAAFPTLIFKECTMDRLFNVIILLLYCYYTVRLFNGITMGNTRGLKGGS